MINSNEPTWLAEARKHIGEREIKGAKHSSWIVSLWKKIKRGGIKDDETPWCAAFVGACLEDVGIVSSRFESAKSYETWGVDLKAPTLGCIVVLTREGGGHVGFAVGHNGAGKLLILGGNQGDEVNIRAFGHDRTISAKYRWPTGVAVPNSKLPMLAHATYTVSKAEA